tara:strand:- start:424 stop:1302 length:879 start_codon:yes stop_codon:yes gene_type:complete
MKRIAIQFSGLFRGLRFKENRDLQHERTVKSFEDQGFEVDTFWFLYDKELPKDSKIIPSLSDTFNAKKITVYKDSAIQSLLLSSNIEKNFSFPESWYETSIDNTVLLNFFGEKTKVSKYHNCYGWFKYLFSLKKCTELRKLYEKEQNTKYDLILLVEVSSIPDDKFIFQETQESIHVSKEHRQEHIKDKLINGYWGSFFMGNEKNIDTICNLYDYMIKKEFENDDSEISNYIYSEKIYKKYIDSKCKVEYTLPIPKTKLRWFFPLGGDDDVDAYLSKYNTSMKKLKETYPEE